MTGPAPTGPASGPVSVRLTTKPDVPIACTLDPAAMPDRLDEWRTVLARARSRTATSEGRLRIEFGDEVAVARLADLVAAEQRCCAFFSFALTVDDRGLGLEVDAPEGAGEILASLFGTPDGS